MKPNSIVKQRNPKHIEYHGIFPIMMNEDARIPNTSNKARPPILAAAMATCSVTV
jgi:hypothetical protein